MVMPLTGRVVSAVVGGLLVIAVWSSVTGTLIVSRSVSSRLTRWVDRAVDWAYQLVGRAANYRRRDRLLATQAAAVLLGQLEKALAQPGHGGNVDLPGDGHHHVAAFGPDLNGQCLVHN